MDITDTVALAGFPDESTVVRASQAVPQAPAT